MANRTLRSLLPKTDSTETSNAEVGHQYNVTFKGHEPKLKRSGGYAQYHFSKQDLANILQNWDSTANWEKMGKQPGPIVEGQRHPTSITRKVAAAPITDYLATNPAPVKRILYHGVGDDEPGAFALGEGGAYIHKYDKFHDNEEYKKEPPGQYDEIHSPYVLNVTEPEDGKKAMQLMHDKLAPNGKAIVSVRRDLKRKPSLRPLLKKSENLAKMSRPMITLPKFKGTSTRPDQEVQQLETTSQLKLYGKKVANAHIETAKKKFPNVSPERLKAASDKSAKAVQGRLTRRSLGLAAPTPRGPMSAAVSGKLRSKHEQDSPEHKAKLTAHDLKRSAIVREANHARWAHSAKARELWAAMQDNPESLEAKQAYAKHYDNPPIRPVLPKAPAKRAVKTKDLPADQQIARNRAVESTTIHESLHHILAQVANKFGEHTAKAIRNKLVGAFDPHAITTLGDYISTRMSYKRSDPHFSEELLAHARDILVNPAKREAFRKFAGDKTDEIIKQFKVGHQKAYQLAQSLTPEDVAKKP